MTRRIIALLFTLLILPFHAPAEAPQEEAPVEVVFIPYGEWTLLENDAWLLTTGEKTSLTETQRAAALAAGIPLDAEGMLPADTALDAGARQALYPDAGDLLAPPVLVKAAQPDPPLEMFELHGEWFYGEDDILYYRHDDDTALLTADEVFTLLHGGSLAPAAEEKIVYLTIDDAPSRYTMELLAVLDRLNVKATFFVVGAYVKNLPEFTRAIYDQGHLIANHSYNHNERLLRESYGSCLRDFQRCQEAVSAALGFEYPMSILRVPYGASTIPVAFREQLQLAGYLWIDWNALNGDTESDITSDQQALDRAISTAGRYDGSIVMLVHDGKKRTIRTLPALVEHFRAQGYEFRVLSMDVPKIDGVRTGFPMTE